MSLRAPQQPVPPKTATSSQQLLGAIGLIADIFGIVTFAHDQYSLIPIATGLLAFITGLAMLIHRWNQTSNWATALGITVMSIGVIMVTAITTLALLPSPSTTSGSGAKPGLATMKPTKPPSTAMNSPTPDPSSSAFEPAFKDPVFWNDEIEFAQQGIDFDKNPPSVTNGKGIYYRQPQSILEKRNPFEGKGVLFAKIIIMYGGLPTKEKCLDVLQKDPQPAIDYSQQAATLDFCFRTPANRIGTFRYTLGFAESPRKLKASAIVWN